MTEFMAMAPMLVFAAIGLATAIGLRTMLKEMAATYREMNCEISRDAERERLAHATRRPMPPRARIVALPLRPRPAIMELPPAPLRAAA